MVFEEYKEYVNEWRENCIEIVNQDLPSCKARDFELINRAILIISEV